MWGTASRPEVGGHLTRVLALGWFRVVLGGVRNANGPRTALERPRAIGPGRLEPVLGPCALQTPFKNGPELAQR
jgi:hypothetical protein